jgi:hypothetical protein
MVIPLPCYECGENGKLVVKPSSDFRQNLDPFRNSLVECPNGHTREMTESEMAALS